MSDVESIDWNDPIHGTSVPTLAEAQASLPFELIEPNGVGEPDAVFVGPQGDSPPDIVALVYDTSAYGRVVVIEQTPTQSAKEFHDWISELLDNNGTANIVGSFERTTIRGGAEALVANAETRSTIVWLEAGLQFTIRGPDLTRDDTVAIAEGL